MSQITSVGAIVSLPNKLNIRGISSVYDILTDQDTGLEILSIDVPSDAEVDLSFVQMIEAARLHFSTSGRSLLLCRPATGTLLDVLKRGGFFQSFSAEDRKFWLHEEVMQ